MIPNNNTKGIILLLLIQKSSLVTLHHLPAILTNQAGSRGLEIIQCDAHKKSKKEDPGNYNAVSVTLVPLWSRST